MDFLVVMVRVIHTWVVEVDSLEVISMDQDPPLSQEVEMPRVEHTVVMAIDGSMMVIGGIGTQIRLFLLRRMVIILVMLTHWNLVCVLLMIRPLCVIEGNSTMVAMDKKIHWIIYLFSR